MRLLEIRLLPGPILVLLAALAAMPGAMAQTPPAPQPAASSSAPGGLSPNLPLRRDVATASEGSPWVAGLVLAGVFVVAGALVLQRRRPALLRGWGAAARAGGAGIERLSSQPLTAQASVHAVRWKDEEFLLGCTAQQVTVLARRTTAGPQGEQP
jgi:flagellar biogenesis protein FliO